MTILVSDTSATYKAQIRSDVSRGFKQIYTATCTMGERQAAQAVVRKYFGDDSAQTVRPVTDASDVLNLCGEFFKEPKRKQVFTVWTFNPKAKATHE